MGGGGGTSASTIPSSATEVAAGLWLGTTSSGRTITGIVRDDGTYWIFYSAVNNSALIAGVVQGTGVSTGGSFSSNDALDFNLEGQGMLPATLSVSFTIKQNFDGTVTYTTVLQAYTFTTAYSGAYDLTPALATIAGTYTGTGATLGLTEATTLTIDAFGAINGSGVDGCTFTGTVTPHARGNIYDTQITFGGGVCSGGTSTVTGVGFFDAATKILRVATLNNTRSDGFIFVGTKP